MRNRLFSLLIPSALLLGLLTACGGSSKATSSTSTPVPAGFSYTDPTSSGWRLVKDASSTSTRLVLNLVGPTGLKARGVGFNLQAPEAVKFGTFPNKWHAEDAGVFELKNTAPDPVNPPTSPEPVFFAAGVKPGNLLTVGIFQKDRRATAKELASPLVRIAVEFNAASAQDLAIGSPVSLSVLKARMVKEDIGNMNDGLDMRAKARMETIEVAVGALILQ